MRAFGSDTAATNSDQDGYLFAIYNRLFEFHEIAAQFRDWRYMAPGLQIYYAVGFGNGLRDISGNQNHGTWEGVTPARVANAHLDAVLNRGLRSKKVDDTPVDRRHIARRIGDLFRHRDRRPHYRNSAQCVRNVFGYS